MDGTQDGTDRMEQGVWVGRVEGESRGVRDSSEESTLGVDGGASIETGCWGRSRVDLGGRFSWSFPLGSGS